MKSRSYRFNSPEETATFARSLAARLGPGDVILLFGGLGAGKTHFARALIQARMQEHDAIEDVPSPTFTIVQTYNIDDVEIWHTDLYRLSGPDEAEELGLEDAFENAICLVEWPDRLKEMTPKNALSLAFEMSDVEGERYVKASFLDQKWADILK